jgi:hypothetical protein
LFRGFTGEDLIGSEDGSSLLPYRHPDANDITVNGEINKLASNIGQARVFAGIHWLSNHEWGLRLGEAVANQRCSQPEQRLRGRGFRRLYHTKFDGTTITI